PTPIIVVTGRPEGREVELAMNTLRTGAVAVLRKPVGPQSPLFEETVQKLLTTVKTMSQVKVVRHWRSAAPRTEPPPRLSPARGEQPGQVVAIATSTGGPAALHRLLSGLP